MKEFIKTMLFGLQIVAGSYLVVANVFLGILSFNKMLTATGFGAIGLFVLGLVYLFVSGFWLFVMGHLRPSASKGE